MGYIYNFNLFWTHDKLFAKHWLHLSAHWSHVLINTCVTTAAGSKWHHKNNPLAEASSACTSQPASYTHCHSKHTLSPTSSSIPVRITPRLYIKHPKHSVLPSGLYQSPSVSMSLCALSLSPLQTVLIIPIYLNGLGLLHLNIRSLLPPQKTGPSKNTAFSGGSWYFSNNDYAVSLNGFNLYRMDRSGRGWGMAIYVKSQVLSHSTTCCDHSKMLWIFSLKTSMWGLMTHSLCRVCIDRRSCQRIQTGSSNLSIL